MGKIANTTAAVLTAATFAVAYYTTVPESAAPMPRQAAFTDDITGIQVETPEVQVASVDKTDTIELDVIDPENVEVSASAFSDNAPQAVTVEDVAADVPRYANLLSEQQALLRDRRNIRYDPALNSLDSANWAAWKKIYTDPEYLNYKMAYKPLPSNLRIINEVWAPCDLSEWQTMIQNLTQYRRWGYNSVLVCFDTSENLLDLMCAVDYIKSVGMKVVIVYTGGRETLHDSVFRDPAKICGFLKVLAPKADALLLGWWRTGVHLFIPDAAYTNYMVKSARDANPDLPVIGQAYWGQTAETGTDRKNFRVTVALPENASAVLVMGMGYPGAASKRTLETLFKDIASHPHKIALVAGEKPYYDTRNQTGKSFQANRKIKRQLELRLLRAGFRSTMTFSGDGSNGMYEKNKTENLCLEYAK